MARQADLIRFADAAAMAERVADVVEAQIGRAVAERGAARIALSGGSTPAGLYKTLSKRELDWARVTAVLLDERWVPPGQEGSNETFIRNTLASGAAASVRIVGLWRDAPSPADAERKLEDLLRRNWRPFDAVVLGMGTDGHTASWFPHAEGLDRALGSERLVCAVQARPSAAIGAYRDRMTLTLGALADARFACLLLSGKEKRKAFEKAAGDGPVEDMPVRAILRARPDLWVCWADS